MNRMKLSILSLALAATFATFASGAFAADYSAPDRGYARSGAYEDDDDRAYAGTLRGNGADSEYAQARRAEFHMTERGRGWDHTRGDGRLSDASIERRVERALTVRLGRDARHINVEVARQTVFLSGGVKNEWLRRAARAAANDVYGVREVRARDLRVYRR